MVLLHVHDVYSPVYKSLKTYVALVGALTGVCPQVDIEHVPPIEGLTAMRAHKVSPLIVDIHVTIKSTFRMSLNSAKGALELLLPVNGSEVLFVSDLAAGNLTANVARYLVIFGVTPGDVFTHIHTTVELQSALFARIRLNAIMPVHVTIHSLWIYGFTTDVAHLFTLSIISPAVVLLVYGFWHG